MFPILARIGPFTLHTYGLLVALGFFAGYALTSSLGKKNGLTAEFVAEFCWVALLGGLLGARLLYVAFHWSGFAGDPVAILRIWEGGLVWFGGFLGALAGTGLWLRRRGVPPIKVADIAAPGLALGHFLGRLGCFAAGCCFGRVCELPWAVRFLHRETLAPQGLALHPTQLYEAVFNLLLCGGLLLLHKKPSFKPGSGRIALLYVGFYSVGRFFIEFWRGDHRGPTWAALSSTQWVALALAATALFFCRKVFTGRRP